MAERTESFGVTKSQAEALYTRRRFLKASGAAALGVVGLWALGGCASEQDAGGGAPEGESVQPSESTPSAYPLTIVQWDGDGNEFEQTYEKAPESAITLTDSTAEIMCRLGLASLVVGAVDPEAAMPDDIAADYESIPKLGDKKTLSREVIVGYAPQIVLGRAMTFTQANQTDPATYNDLGISLYVQTATAEKGNPTLQGVIDDVENIARIFDAQEAAQPLLDDMNARMEAIDERVAEQASSSSPQSVLIMTNFIDGSFGTFGGTTGATLQFNIIEQLGGTMASTESASGLTYENLIVANPDIILYITAERNKETDPLVLETLYSEPSIQSVPAIANQKVVEIPYAEFMDTTPRIFDSVETILEAMYPQE